VNRRRLIFGVVSALVVGVFLFVFPLFRVVPLGGGDSRVAVPSDAPHSAADYARVFWNDVLPESYEQAVEIQQLFQAFDDDVAQARQQFGRQVGIGGTTYFFVRGIGEVQEVKSNRLLVSIEGHDRQACIETGPIFGNAVRDGTGLIDSSIFPSSQEYNALSAELNRRVETEVLAPVERELSPGDRLEFVGCAQSRSDHDIDPLCMVAVKLRPLDRENVQ